MEAEHLKSKLNTSSSLLNDWFVIQPLQTHLRAPPQKRPVTVNKERLSHQLDFNRSVEKRVVLRGTKFNQTLKKLKMLEVNQIPKMHAIRANPMNDHTRRSKNADHQNNMTPVIWCLKRNKSMPVIGLEEKQFQTNSQLMNSEKLSSKRTNNKEGTEVEKPLNMATSTQPVFNPVTRIVDQGVFHSSKSNFFSANSKRPETAQYSKSDPLAKNTSALMLARDDLHSSLPQNRIRIRTAIPKARSAAASKLNTPQRSPTDQKSFKELLQRAQEDRKAHTATDWKKFSKQTNRHHDLMSSTQQRIATNESNFAGVNDGKTRSKSAFFRAHRESMIKDTTQQVEEEWNPFTEERLPTLEQEMNNQEDHHRIQENDIILASEDLSAQEEELLQKETAPFRGKKKAHIIIQKKPAQNTSKRRVHSLDPEFDTDDVHQLKIRMDDRRLFLRPLPIHMPDISINLIGGKFKTRWRIIREKLISKPYTRPNSKTFIDAAKDGNADAIEWALFRDRYLVCEFDHANMTALHWSARRGHTEVVKLLIENHSDVEARDIVGRTPLYYAAEYKRIETLKLLLAAKASPWSTFDYSLHECMAEDAIIKYYIRKARLVKSFLDEPILTIAQDPSRAKDAKTFPKANLLVE